MGKNKAVKQKKSRVAPITPAEVRRVIAAESYWTSQRDAAVEAARDVAELYTWNKLKTAHVNSGVLAVVVFTAIQGVLWPAVGWTTKGREWISKAREISKQGPAFKREVGKAIADLEPKLAEKYGAKALKPNDVVALARKAGYRHGVVLFGDDIQQMAQSAVLKAQVADGQRNKTRLVALRMASSLPSERLPEAFSSIGAEGLRSLDLHSAFELLNSGPITDERQPLLLPDGSEPPRPAKHVGLHRAGPGNRPMSALSF